MKNTKLRLAKSLSDAEKIRRIRNECREYMTHDTREISPTDQKVWFVTKYKEMRKNGEMNLYVFEFEDQIAGFGVVRYIHGLPWLTGGLSIEFQGKKLGRVLFYELVNATNAPEVWLDVLKTNTRGIKTYEKLGFVIIIGSHNQIGQELWIMRLSR